MISRLDQLEENRLVNSLVRVGKDQQKMKAEQLAGSDTIVMQRIFSGNAADITLTTIGFNDKAFYLVFTPDSTEFNTSIVYKMEYTYTEVTGSGGTSTISAQRLKVGTDNVQRWLFVLNGSDFFPTASVSIKFFLWASGPGTMTTEVI
jgi:hypothetical protein